MGALYHWLITFEISILEYVITILWILNLRCDLSQPGPSPFMWDQDSCSHNHRTLRFIIEIGAPIHLEQPEQ